MGIAKFGPWCNYSGKIGSLVYYIRNGKAVVRTVGKMTKPPTKAQLKNRGEMAVVIDFIKPVLEFINLGFKAAAKDTGKTAYNHAVSYHKKNALKGTYPAEIDFEKVLVTKGEITDAIEPNVEMVNEGLKFDWQCPAYLSWPRTEDQVMLLVYFPVLKKAAYLIMGARRRSCTEILKIEQPLMMEYMEIYISFIAQDRNTIATSTYLGNFNAENR